MFPYVMQISEESSMGYKYGSVECNLEGKKTCTSEFFKDDQTGLHNMADYWSQKIFEVGRKYGGYKL